MKFLKSLFLRSFIRNLAKSNDTRTTLLGLIAAALLAAQVDWSKLVAGDPAEIGKTLAVIVAALWGHWTNKPTAATNSN